MRLEGQVGLVVGAVDRVLVEVQLDAGLAARRGARVIDLDLERVLGVRDRWDREGYCDGERARLDHGAR